MLCNRNFIAFA